MSLAQFADASFAYPGTDILAGASLLIRPGDRLALLAPNGAGKSTVLRLLAGDLQLDGGDVRVLGRASVAYLRQSQELSGGGTVLDAILEPFADLRRLHEQLIEIEARLGDGDPAELARYGELQERYQPRAGYELEARVKRLTMDVGFAEADLARPVDTLSGGERGRLELAKVLVQQPDLLLLDEPTNHLDLAAIERLETFLAEYPGAFVLVSHDRAFIRAVCREIVELESGQVRALPVRLRQVRGRARRAPRAGARRVRAAEGARRQDRGLHPPQPGRPEDEAGAEPAQDARQAGTARTPRGRVATRGEDRPRVPDRRRPGRQGDDPRAAAHGRLSRRAADPARRDRQHLPRRQGRHRRSERQRQVDAAQDAAGRAAAARREDRDRGTGVRIGYFDQKLGSLDEDRCRWWRRSVRCAPICHPRWCASTWPSFASSATTRSGRCAACRAASAAGWRWPRSCCSRATCWCWTSRPTTWTSRRARRWKTRSAEYEGTLIVVSHDRYFLDRVCTRLLVIDGTALEAHLGNYSDWRHRVRQAERARPAPAPAPPPTPKPAPQAAAASAAARAADKERERERRRLARRVETLEADVSKLEAELAAVRQELGRRSRRRLAEAAHAGRPRTRARRVAREADRGVGSGQRRPAQPIRNILRVKDLTGAAVVFGVAPCPSHHTLIV